MASTNEHITTDHIFLWQGGWLLHAASISNRPHRHVSASLLVGLEKPFLLGVEGATITTRLALVAPDIEQSLDSLGGRMLIVHLDPDTDSFRSVRHNLAEQSWCDFSWPEAGFLFPNIEVAEAEEARGVLESLLDYLGAQTAEALDNRIKTVVSLLREEPPETINVDQLAESVNLSASRLTHLAKQELGVSLKRFALSLKLQQAVRKWNDGMPLSELAVDAGFYDQSHFVRTVRTMLDIKPSDVMNQDGMRVVYGFEQPAL